MPPSDFGDGGFLGDIGVADSALSAPSGPSSSAAASASSSPPPPLADPLAFYDDRIVRGRSRYCGGIYGSLGTSVPAPRRLRSALPVVAARFRCSAQFREDSAEQVSWEFRRSVLADLQSNGGDVVARYHYC